MGNFTFSEIFTILIVILIVFGPQRLPELARKAGALAARARSAVDSLKAELNSEYGEVLTPLKEARDEMRTVSGELKGQITAFGKEVTAAGDSIKSDVNALTQPTGDPTPGEDAGSDATEGESPSGLKGAAEKAINQVAASNAFIVADPEVTLPANGSVTDAADEVVEATSTGEDLDQTDATNG